MEQQTHIDKALAFMESLEKLGSQLKAAEEQQKHLQGEVCLDDAFFHVTDYVIEEKYGYTLCLCLFLCFRTEKGVRHDS